MMQTIRDILRPQQLSNALAIGLAQGLIHLVGVATVFILSAIWLLDAAVRSALWEAYSMGAYGAIPAEALLHLGLSMVGWACIYITFRLLTAVPKDSSPRLVKARGTVIVETIIVLPVLLLLVLGLLQLIVLNSAGLLSTLASYNAARVVAVWGPEAESGRNDVDDDLVAEKARLAAAAAVAPVAPADFFYTNDCSGNTDALEDFLSGLEMGGYSVDLGPLGSMGITGHTNHTAMGPASGARGNLSVPMAFDSTDLATRGQRKMGFAYCAMTVQLNNAASDSTPCDGELCGDIDIPEGPEGDEAGATIAYQQQMAFPIAERVFGSGDFVAGRHAYYSTIERSHTFTAQMDSNPDSPGGLLNTLSDITNMFGL